MKAEAGAVPMEMLLAQRSMKRINRGLSAKDKENSYSAIQPRQQYQTGSSQKLQRAEEFSILI
jgi:hypothetical protein